MKITPVASPHAMSQTQTTTNNTQARAKAIQMLTQEAPPAPTQENTQKYPIQNANEVSVEELGAIKAQTQPVSTEAETTQPDQTESNAEIKPANVETKTSKEWAALARQERAIRAKAHQQEQQFKAREAALAEREAKLSTQTPDTAQFISRDRLKQDALSVLDEAGVSYDELTQQIISRQPIDPRLLATVNSLKQEIKDLKQANENNQKNYQEQQQQSYQAAIKQIKTDATNLVKSDPNFETIKATNSINDVVELITKTYEKDGIVLSVEEAAEEVENYLVEEALKLTQVGKIKARMQQNVQTAKPVEKTPATSSQTPMKTLTNAAGSTRQLSVRERAIAAMEGRLK